MAFRPEMKRDEWRLLKWCNYLTVRKANLLHWRLLKVASCCSKLEQTEVEERERSRFEFLSNEKSSNLKDLSKF